LQIVAWTLQDATGSTTVDCGPQNDIMCRFSAQGKPQFVVSNLRFMTKPGVTLDEVLAGYLFGFDGGGIDEHDRDVILDGVNAMASATFQAVPLVERHRLFANGANQQIKKVLGNHGEIVA
jgi:hypothetical protein